MRCIPLRHVCMALSWHWMRYHMIWLYIVEGWLTQFQQNHMLFTTWCRLLELQVLEENRRLLFKLKDFFTQGYSIISFCASWLTGMAVLKQLIWGTKGYGFRVVVVWLWIPWQIFMVTHGWTQRWLYDSQGQQVFHTELLYKLFYYPTFFFWFV